ncbi:MAG: nucleotidyltransferase domain-containing protein [Candidatus Woesearchaeota archaeon]
MVNELKIVQTLGKNLKNEMTMRQLSIDSNIPYTSTLRFIKENKNLFVINKKGNINLISLNLNDSITKNYLIVAERKECEEYINKNANFKILVRDLPKGDYCLILFGSRAEGKERKKSDVDLCIINKDGKKNLSFSKFELLTQLEVNPMFFMNQEFKLMLKEKEHNLADEIIKKHIILYGEEYFWNLVWKNVV